MEYHVYVIYCPLTRVEKYVGVSNNVEMRMRLHINGSHSDNIFEFMKSLKECGKLPVVKIIQSFNFQYQAMQLETKLIKEYTEAGIVLLNKRHVKKDKPAMYLTDFED